MKINNNIKMTERQKNKIKSEEALETIHYWIAQGFNSEDIHEIVDKIKEHIQPKKESS